MGVLDKAKELFEDIGTEKVDADFVVDLFERLDAVIPASMEREQIASLLSYVPDLGITYAQDDGESEIQALGAGRLAAVSGVIEATGLGLDATVAGVSVGAVLNVIGAIGLVAAAVTPFMTPEVLSAAGAVANRINPDLYGAIGDFLEDRFEGVTFYFLDSWEPSTTGFAVPGILLTDAPSIDLNADNFKGAPEAALANVKGDGDSGNKGLYWVLGGLAALAAAAAAFLG